MENRLVDLCLLACRLCDTQPVLKREPLFTDEELLTIYAFGHIRMMRLAGTIELVGGIATALLGVSLSLYVMKPAMTPLDYLGLFSVTTCAALFVAVGAYAHAVSHNSWGRIPVWAGGITLTYKTASLLLHVPVGLYFLGWVGLFLVLPGVTAGLTVIASLFSGALVRK